MSPTYLDHTSGRTWLKWHRGRRFASDMEFSPLRIAEGMLAGASVEIDLIAHGEDGFAVLHDAVLDRSTTGTGPVGHASVDTLRALTLRDNQGKATDIHVALLGDLCAQIALMTCKPGAVLQLDMKSSLSDVSDVAVTAFQDAVAPVAEHMILSGGDAPLVRKLGADVAGLKIGHDPCEPEPVKTLHETRDFNRFVEDALIDAGDASMIYLWIKLIELGWSDGFDLIGAFKEKDFQIDAWTVKTIDAQNIALCQRLMDHGVDQITTDDPDALYAAFAG